jgi:hypothetical protein
MTLAQAVAGGFSLPRHCSPCDTMIYSSKPCLISGPAPCQSTRDHYRLTKKSTLISLTAAFIH